jgi:hypothetical protein
MTLLFILLIFAIAVFYIYHFFCSTNEVDPKEWPIPITAPANDLLKSLKDLVKACPNREIKEYLKEIVFDGVKGEVSFEAWLNDKKKDNIQITFDFQDQVVQAIYELYGKSLTIHFRGLNYKTIKDKGKADKLKKDFEEKELNKI